MSLYNRAQLHHCSDVELRVSGMQSTFQVMGPRGKRLAALGSSFLDGAGYVFAPFPVVEYRRFTPRDPREDAIRLSKDAQRVADDFRRSVNRVVDESRGSQ